MANAVETMFSVREKPWHYEMTKEVTKTKSVKTGDENNMALPFAAGALALIAIAFILIEEKKRRRV